MGLTDFDRLPAPTGREQIRPSLPPRLRVSHKWTLLYSLDQHGISLHTLFANLDRGLRDRDGGFVLVIKSERGEVFGGYCSEALRDGSSGPGSYGGGGSARNGTSQRWTGDGSWCVFSFFLARRSLSFND